MAHTPVDPARSYEVRVAAKIFLVEDDPTLTRLLQAVLESEGYSCRIFFSPDQFLSEVGAAELEFGLDGNLLISDLDFEGSSLSGERWLLELVRSPLYRKMPILIHSGRAPISLDFLGAEGAGRTAAIAQLPKGSDMNQLLGALRNLIVSAR